MSQAMSQVSGVIWDIPSKKINKISQLASVFIKLLIIGYIKQLLIVDNVTDNIGFSLQYYIIDY